jgi:hypothetical protein
MTNPATKIETCPETVWSGDSWNGRRRPCGKPVKRDGLCGIHARSADLAKERERHRELEAAAADATAALARELSALSGLAFSATNFGSFVSLTPDAARSLAAILRGVAS